MANLGGNGTKGKNEVVEQEMVGQDALAINRKN